MVKVVAKLVSTNAGKILGGWVAIEAPGHA
jgi:hypothetical protein